MIENQTVFVIDDDIEICKALEWLFKSAHLGVETYQSGKSFLDNFKPHRQGCIIIDMRMPIMSGLELLELLKIQKNRLPVVMITAYGEIPLAVRAMKAGAIDFILKPINHEALLNLIKEYISFPTILENKKTAEIQQRFGLLSEREMEVLNLIIQGKLNKEIASELHISISTVEVHRSRIMHKLQVKNLAHLIKLCLQSRYLEEFFYD